MNNSVLNYLIRMKFGLLFVPVLILTPLLFASAPAYALGLGTLTLNSHLNEKLDATVPLLLTGSETMKKVSVELASPGEYRQMGLPWNGFLKLVRVEIHNRMSGAPYVKLVSPLAVNAPLLSLVLKTSKEGRGTYFRHYQVFLDPNEMPALYDKKPEVIAINNASDTPSVNIDNAGDWARIWRYGPVKAGDSLSEVAYRLRKDKRFSNKQVMMALYEGNPESFANGDINHLKKGAWLQVPKGEVVTSYGSTVSMQKLSRLLASASTSGTATTTEVKPAAPSASTDEELQYSGNITLNKASGTATTTQTADLASLQKLDSIHEEVMSGKLQMSDLSNTVANLGKSVTGIEKEMKVLKADVIMLKAKAEASSSSEDFNYWMAGFFVVLIAFGIAVISLLNRRQVKGAWEKPAEAAAAPAASSAVTKKEVVEVKEEKVPELKPEVKPKVPETLTLEPAAPAEASMESESTAEVEPSPEVTLENETLANKIEESLGHCDYEKAEQMLQAGERQYPDSLRLAALKAQLYHETEREELRNELINSISESSDKKRWEEFCKVLPSHVWNACFGDGEGIQ
ncbi:hypothetical protein F3F96_12150 [Mariprofundus sp. NF]|uniref:type IV pilus assembly protein FimV n=1 Tax=Mariprofundus sp. NF TaxID=2608716 RepID=UPI0015A27708|nr:FimV/HubP family polar landmark protein [Mariprofundus sp. NF]NWF39882.1 hypothetical protein [Mariprofundus sp. NF]